MHFFNTRQCVASFASLLLMVGTLSFANETVTSEAEKVKNQAKPFLEMEKVDPSITEQEKALPDALTNEVRTFMGESTTNVYDARVTEKEMIEVATTGQQKSERLAKSDDALSKILKGGMDPILLPEEDQKLINMLKANVDKARGEIFTAMKDESDMNAIMDKFLDGRIQNMPNSERDPKRKGPEIDTYVLISMSIPEGQLKAFWEQLPNAENQNTVFVLQGWKGTTINDAAKEWFASTSLKEKDKTKIPKIMVEPRLFMKFGVTEVPLIIAEVNGKWGAVYGMVDLHEARLKIGNAKSNFEHWGAVYPIVEPNFYDMVKQRVEKQDWQKQKQHAIASANNIYKGIDIPVADKKATYLKDLSIIVNNPIVDEKGNVLAQAGTVINPFDTRPLTRALVFFDGTDKRQFEIVKKWTKRFPRTVLMATKLPLNNRDRQKVRNALGQDVFMLNEGYARRFGVKAIPSVAFQEGRQLRYEVETVL